MTISKNEFLYTHIFCGLLELKTDFDAPTIFYFSEEDFAIILDRIEHYGCGIYGIETYINNEYCDTEVFETNGGKPCDPAWYRGAFESFRNYRSGLEYSATYHMPEELLEKRSQ